MVIVKRMEQYLEIQISDNGAGLMPDFNLSSANSLGMTLIKGLSAQLEGKFTIDNSEGVTIKVRFPVIDNTNHASALLENVILTNHESVKSDCEGLY